MTPKTQGHTEAAVQLQISLDQDESTAYTPGDFISGTVHFTILREVRINQIDLQFYGVSETAYTYSQGALNLHRTTDKDTSILSTHTLPIWYPEMDPQGPGYLLLPPTFRFSKPFKIRIPKETLPLKNGEKLPLPSSLSIVFARKALAARVMYELRAGVMYSEVENLIEGDPLDLEQENLVTSPPKYAEKFAISGEPICIGRQKVKNMDHSLSYTLVKREPERTYTGSPSRPPLKEAYAEPAVLMCLPNSVKQNHEVSPKAYLLSNLDPKQFVWEHSDKADSELMRNGLGKFVIKSVKTKITRHTKIACGIYTDHSTTEYKPKPIDLTPWEFDLAYLEPITEETPIPKKFKNQFAYYIDITQHIRNFNAIAGTAPSIGLDNVNVSFEIVHEIRFQPSMHSCHHKTMKVKSPCNILP